MAQMRVLPQGATTSTVELISIHIPKCAGNSFSQVLARNYPGGLHLDYEDRPLDPQAPFQRNFAAWKRAQAQLASRSWSAAKVIHGHFWAGKYDALFPDARKITWLRHPVNRLVSHYYYWKSVPDLPHSLHKYMRENDLSLLEFAQLPQIQNILHDTFLRHSKLDEFAFIGIHEHFQEDLHWLVRHMNWKAQEVPEQNRTVYEGYDPNALDAGTEKKLRALNEADLEIYETALQMRTRRMAEPDIWVRFSKVLRGLRSRA